MGILRKIRESWFLIGIVLVILLAKLAPHIGIKNGVLHPEYTIKYLAVSIIFFNSGVSLPTEDLRNALFHLRIHVFIQGFTFIIFPLIIGFIVGLLSSSAFNVLLLQGLTVLSCMPPPVSSAVLLTKSVGGNEAAAIFNSAFGSFLGIFVTPALLLLLVGTSADVPVFDIFSQLSITVVCPLLIGQLIRSSFKSSLERKKIPFSDIGSFMLLLIIYTTFCETFSNDIHLDLLNLLAVIFAVLLIQCSLLGAIFYVTSSSRSRFTPRDVIALMFCCTHKSLTLGIPIINIVFNNYEGVSVISIPLLIYHPTQILLGGMIVPMLRGWLIASEKIRPVHLMNV